MARAPAGLRPAGRLCYHRDQMSESRCTTLRTALTFPPVAGDRTNKEGCMALLKIFVGTMYGGSLDVAEQVQPLFEQAGYTVDVLDQLQEAGAKRISLQQLER